MNTLSSNPIIIIYCPSMVLGDLPFSKDYYWQAYQDLLLNLKAQGCQAYFASGEEHYKGSGHFDVVYDMDEKCELSELKIVHDVTADVVFDRGNFIAHDVVVINHPELLRIADDKAAVYAYFGDFQPESIVCPSPEEVPQALQRLPGERAVVKDPYGEGGKEVFIDTKEHLAGRHYDFAPMLVQEFLDTSKGVPGIMMGVHDVRLSVCGGEIIGFYVRQAKAGVWHSNVSQGGKMIFCSVKDVPHEVRKMVTEIDQCFIEHPRYYAADFMYTEKGWKLVELNPYLALLPRTDGDEAVLTLERLTKYLVTVASEVVATRRNVPVRASNSH